MTISHDVAPLVTRASGAAGNVVFSRNRHGPYSRARTIPTDPNTALQVVIRNAMSELTVRWRDVLTAAQRAAWDLYALNVLLPNRLGRRTNVSGLAMYVRSNVPRIQTTAAALPRLDTAPASFNLPSFTPITRVVLNVVDNTVHPFFAPDDGWANVVGAGLIFWISAPQPTTVNFFKGPFRFAGTILGNVGFNPASPGTVALPVPAGVADRVFVRYRLTSLDGRLSSDNRLPADIVSQVAPVPITASGPFGPFNQFSVTFDQLLKFQPHATSPWSIHQDGRNWIVNVVTTFPFLTPNVVFVTTRGGIAPRLDRVTFTPPPSDIDGLLTGLTAPAFVNFPIT